MSQLPPEKESQKESQKESKSENNSKFLASPMKKVKGMKKLGAIALVVVILLGFGAIGYGIMGRRKPKTDPIAELTVAVEFQNRTVRIQASGTVQPIQSVNLSPKDAGRLEQLRVEQGDRVEAGEIVAIMESKDTSARLVQARARLNRAEARLRELENGNRGEDIAQARARLAQAEASLSELQAGSRGEDIAQARARLAQAQESLAELRAGNRGENIAQARARLAQAQASLAELRAGNRRENIAQARARLAQAQARLTRVKAGSRFEEIAQAEARVVDAQARVELTEVRRKRNQQLADEGAISQDSLDEAVTENRRAQANLQEAQRQLEQLQKNRREELTQAEAEVQEAQQALALQENGPRPEEIARAEAQVQEAQQALALQENGPRPETITQAEAEVNEALGQLREVEVQLEDTIIRAPFSGQITQRYATEGAFVTPTTSASSAGQATSTSIVALARGLEILGKVPEADITQIQPGQRVEIVADAYPDQVFTGKVRLIAPEAIKEQDVTLFEVRVDIDSGFEELRSGMNVDVTFLGDELKNALVVPTVAIVTNKGETGVLVPNEKNEAVFRPVTIGPTIGNDIQILSGLESGDRVFVGLPPGQKLEDILKNED